MHSGCMHIAPGTVLTSKLKALTETDTETTQVGEGGGQRQTSAEYKDTSAVNFRLLDLGIIHLCEECLRDQGQSKSLRPEHISNDDERCTGNLKPHAPLEGFILT